MKIVITGATGLLGRRLVRKLQVLGHSVHALCRRREDLPELPPAQVWEWDALGSRPPSGALAGAGAVIHLAGAPVAEGRWSAARKKLIQDSRWVGTRNLVAALGGLKEEERPCIFLSASAIGFYGESPDHLFTEDDPAGEGFLAETVVGWEREAGAAEKLGMRVALLRFGVVLAPEGGALAKMAPVVLGNGKQWFSWIHAEDVCRFVSFALEEERVSGAFNLTSPRPVTNREFTKAYAEALGYPFTFPAPALALRAALGEMASAVLGSQKVIPRRALDLGFTFRYPDAAEALKGLYAGRTYLDSAFQAAQFVPVPLEEAFSFFSRAENLEEITPPWLSFRITKVSSAKVQEGTLIDYKLRIKGVPVRWRSGITGWRPPHSFADHQLKGPYQRWDHTHGFHGVPGGTLLTDDVVYRLPGHLAGKLLAGAFVKRDVETIFRYRQGVIGKIFRR